MGQVYRMTVSVKLIAPDSAVAELDEVRGAVEEAIANISEVWVDTVETNVDDENSEPWSIDQVDAEEPITA